MAEMHDVVEMLLNRIKDYPEDFVSEPSQNKYNLIGGDSPTNKWSKALNLAYQVATDEEKLALDEATTDAKRAIYMGAALKTIMSEEVREEGETMKVKSSGRYFGTSLSQAITDIQGIAQGSAQQAQLAQIEYRQQMAQSAMQNALNRSHLGAYNNATNNT